MTRRQRIFLWSLFLLSIFLQLGKIQTEIWLIDQNAQYNQGETQLGKLKEENAALRQEILKEAALTRIKAKAKAMGFIELQTIVLTENKTTHQR